MATETITLGGGCFWCLEAVYLQAEGVVRAESGYAGGDVEDPEYESVCSGTTGHAEVVQVEFDPARVTLREILEIFFTIHDPTTLNRQGNDVGTQYRSAIFWHDAAQQGVAMSLMEELEDADVWDSLIVTELTELDRFWPAEDYHRAYYERNSGQPYCQIVVAPKLAKFRARFGGRLAHAAEE